MQSSPTGQMSVCKETRVGWPLSKEDEYLWHHLHWKKGDKNHAHHTILLPTTGCWDFTMSTAFHDSLGTVSEA
jgi:hypothetical protein